MEAKFEGKTLGEWIAERDFCQNVIDTDRYIQPVMWYPRLEKAEKALLFLLNEEKTHG